MHVGKLLILIQHIVHRLVKSHISSSVELVELLYVETTIKEKEKTHFNVTVKNSYQNLELTDYLVEPSP